jgi:hypothetical protein
VNGEPFVATARLTVCWGDHIVAVNEKSRLIFLFFHAKRYTTAGYRGKNKACSGGAPAASRRSGRKQQDHHALQAAPIT